MLKGPCSVPSQAPKVLVEALKTSKGPWQERISAKGPCIGTKGPWLSPLEERDSSLTQPNGNRPALEVKPLQEKKTEMPVKSTA